MVEKRELAKNGAVGGFQGDAKPRQLGLLQRMAEMMRRGHRGNGNICRTAGHPFGDRNRRVHLDTDVVAQACRVLPVV